MAPISDLELRRLRLRSQGLARPTADSVVEVVRRVVGLQAQDTRMARLLVRPRSVAVDAAAVDRACATDRTVVRTWAMRGTLHMVAAEDMRWLVDLLGPVFLARGRSRRHRLGLDDGMCERATRVVEEVLVGRQLTRAALVAELRARGVDIPVGQAPAHLVAYAAMRGVVCRGPDLADDEPSYVLTAEWVGEQPRIDPETALALLARRCLTGHGPAGVADFAAWSGLPIRRARAGIESVAGEFDEVDTSHGPAWVPPGLSAERAPSRLLGHFDPYLLGYRTREFALDPAFAGRIQSGGGFILPAVVVDGWVAGSWRRRRGAGLLRIVVEPFSTLDDETVAELAADVRDIGRFFDGDAVLDLGE